MNTAEIIAELPRLSERERAVIRAKLDELVGPADSLSSSSPVFNHPAIGIWKDRKDLPDDSVEASQLLRKQMLRRES